MVFKQGNIPWNKGKKGVQTIWNKNLPKEQQPRYKKKQSEETKDKIRQALLKAWQDPVYRALQLQHIREQAKSEDYRNKIGMANAIIQADPVRKAKQGERMKSRRSDPKFVCAMLEAQGSKPNKAELKLDSILQDNFPGEFVLNTRAEVLILDRKIPDFVNLGKKKIIEHFGTYWHSKERTGKTKKQEERDKIDFFQKCGYTTLIIWEKELKNVPKLVARILVFLKK